MLVGMVAVSRRTIHVLSCNVPTYYGSREVKDI